jgi:hypothetical protein
MNLNEIKKIPVWLYNATHLTLNRGIIDKVTCSSDSDLVSCTIISKNNYKDDVSIIVSLDRIKETKEIALKLLIDHIKNRIQFLNLDLKLCKERLKLLL